MAFIVLKGNVQFINSDSGSIESMVDDYSNQTIEGIKTFSQMITASLGISSSAYHGDGSGLSGLDVAVTTYDNPVANTVIVAKAANNISGAVGLTYNGAVLAVTGNISASVNVSGSGFYGSAVGLTSIPTTQFVGTISAADLTLGNGVENDSNNLAIKLSNSSGLSLTTNGLGVSPNNAIGIVGGLASADEFLVADNNVSNELRKATITNLQTYMQDNLNFGGAAGSQHQIQFRDGAGSFAASSDLTFNDSTDILNVTGKITASVHVSSSQIYAGELYGNGTGVTQVQKIGFTSPYTASFNVSEQSHIVAVNTSGSSHITASLKAANIYESGAMLVFKDVAGSASANHIVIEPSGSETIDGSDTGIKIQSDYGAVTIASDGNNQFFILGVN